jgi:hypothetical protein
VSEIDYEKYRQKGIVLMLRTGFMKAGTSGFMKAEKYRPENRVHEGRKIQAKGDCVDAENRVHEAGKSDFTTETAMQQTTRKKQGPSSSNPKTHSWAQSQPSD